jgi:S-adenosylmethionine synthetase
MTRKITLQSTVSQPIEARDFEMCEHKGIGHPDTLTDGICEAASRALSRRYRREFGRVLHHNLDKGLLQAGRSETRFGGGRILQPMRLLICGRATALGSGDAAAEVAIAAARDHLRTRIGFEAAADAITLTLALAFVDRHVQSIAHYFALKKAMHDHLSASIAAPALLRINRLDDHQAQDESGLHLTVTGLSGEMGDDGQVGRGNRVSGLITPGRAMSLEAAAGKNPVSHVGKLYNVLATLIARDIHANVAGAEQVGVQLLSANGEPIDQPELAGIEIHAPGGLNVSVRTHAREIADAWLADIRQVTELILDDEIDVH